ncbi:hypothetical protein KFL_001470015 [Klebsormidium nitens]|uniref:Uncharacterized protein n=1 Tax=Klebsormidium nitens TaxID=105231 RepID=A0A1Y1HYZ1_KLENI|nr:hypothetical protein KFL_001470015 [Klebsormidium nitens]|eukprot:GAQ83403.1 hypothetical protein KFL_001470015 [Klebsormidium nitens]
MDPTPQRISEWSTDGKDEAPAPIMSRMFSGNSQKQSYQKLSSPHVRDAEPSADLSQVQPSNTRQPDFRLSIPPGSPRVMGSVELPKSGPLSGAPRANSTAGSPRTFSVTVDEDSSSNGEATAGPRGPNLRFRSAAHAVRLTRIYTRSRLQENDTILPTPKATSSNPATPRFVQRSTPSRSGPLEKSPKSTVPKSGPISPQENDPFQDDEILPEETKPDKRLSCFMFIQLLVTVLLLAGVIVTAVVNPPRKDKWLDLEIWKWLLLAFVLLSGRYIASWLVKLLVRVIERNFLLKNRVLYFVYGLRKSVANCLWLAQVLLVWFIFYDPKTASARKLNIISKILICLQITSALAVLKVLLVKVAANGFHRRAYFDRIQEALFRQFLLEQLSQPSSIVPATDQHEAPPEVTVPKGGLKRTFGSEAGGA